MSYKNLIDILSYENEVFRTYVFWSAILVVKMLALSMLTGMKRHKNKVFVNPEDLPSKQLKVKFGDEEVERVRRAHRNDLENILPFFVIGLFFTLTNPSANVAINLFRAFGISRLVHSFVYAFCIIPKARGPAFGIGLFITVYMAVRTIIFFL